MIVVSKETDLKKDAKSGFEGSRLADRLEDLNVETVLVLGSVTQDCLKQTVLDACKLGPQVVVLKNAIGGIGRAADNLKEISQAGALQATASDFGISPL